MALATRELELIIIARDRSSATMARVAGGMVILGGAMTALGLKGVREFGQMTMEALEFRQQMALAVTQSDNLGATIENVGDIVNRVGTELPVPFEELSDSLFDIFSTFTSDQLSSLTQAEEILRAFGEAAVAGQAPMRDIGRAAIAWINALDQPATLENITKILDVQFELVRKGAGTYEEFAGQIGKAIPAFVGAGQTVDTFGGSLAFLTKNGLTAAMAATSAARAVELMFSPKAIKGLAAVGVEIEDSNGEFRQMNDIIRDLAPIFDELSASQRKIKFKEIFGTGRIQARRFFDLAIPNIAEFDELVQDMELSAGEAAQAFELLFGQPLSTMQLFQNRVESIRREFGDEFIKTLEDRVFPVLETLWQWWTDLDPATKTLIIRMTALSVAVLLVAGAILLTVGFFLLFITLLSAFAGSEAGAIAGLAKLVFALGLIGVILAAVALAAFLIFKNWDKIWPFLVDVWDRVTEAARDFMESNKKFFDEVIKKAKTIWQKLLKLGVAIWERAKAIWEFIWNAMLEFWEVWGEDVLGTIERVWEEIKTIFLGAMDLIIAVLDFFIALFNGDWEALWTATKDILSAAWDIIVDIFKFWAEIISQVWRVFWDNLKEAATDIWNAIFEFLRGIWESIASTAGDIWQGILDFFTGIWDSITRTAKDTIRGSGGLLEFFQNLPEMILDNLFEMLGMSIEWGGKIIGWFLEGVIAKGPELFLWFFTLPGRIIGAIPDMLRVLFGLGRIVLTGLWNGVLWVWNNILWPWFRALPGRIVAAIGNLISSLRGSGGSLLQGFLGGIKWVWNNLLLPWAKGVGRAIIRGVGSLINSLRTAGKNVIQGLWNGMKSRWNDVTRWLRNLNPGSWFNDINVLKGHAIKNLVVSGEQVMQGLQKGMMSGWEKNVRWLGSLNPAGTGIASGLTTSAFAAGQGATTTNNNQTDMGQSFNFGDIISQGADPEEIAAEIGWQVRMQ